MDKQMLLTLVGGLLVWLLGYIWGFRKGAIAAASAIQDYMDKLQKRAKVADLYPVKDVPPKPNPPKGRH